MYLVGPMPIMYYVQPTLDPVSKGMLGEHTNVDVTGVSFVALTKCF
jgi:hypothetical protein